MKIPGKAVKPYFLCCLFRVAVLSKHVFHLNLFPACASCSRSEASRVVATKGCVSGIECDTSKSCAEAVAHARRCSKECEEEEKRYEEQQAQEE